MGDNQTYSSAIYFKGYGVARQKREFGSKITVNVEQYVPDPTLTDYKNVDSRYITTKGLRTVVNRLYMPV